MVNKMDLRIGNKVTLAHESNEPIVTIEKIDYTEVYVAEKNQVFNYEDLMPIKLMPEWLAKIGMKKRFDTPKCNIWDMEKESPTRNRVFCLALIDKGWIYPTAPGALPFHYLHQLQNLYYALTNTEITIQL